MPPYIGRRMRRVEDERLITGRGRFAGDIKLEGLVHIAFCRSGLPHAHIGAIDTSAAKAMPGVIAVWTAHDLPETADGLSDWGPDDMVARGRPILNRDKVNYVGEAYAMGAAETAHGATNACRSLSAELEPLDGARTGIGATPTGAPKRH